jgi:hypothetical protein
MKKKNGHSEAKELEYNYIDDGIFVGTNVCCKTHFDEELGKEGITADVSLEDVRVDKPFGVEFYVWIPVKNHTSPSMDQLEFGVAVLEKIIGMGKKVYVHCQNGHGRAPTLVSAYFVKTRGITPEEAEEFLKSKRPTIHLEDVQRQSLKNFHAKWK